MLLLHPLGARIEISPPVFDVLMLPTPRANSKADAYDVNTTCWGTTLPSRS